MTKTSLGARTIAYILPTWVIGSYDASGRPNLMTASWCGICCSKPPCVCVSLRAATYSHASIQARQAFTVNVPDEGLLKAADWIGMVSGRDNDKFQALGLTAVKSELVDAPYAAQFPMVLECKVLHVHELGMHTQFVGEIMDVKVDAAALGPDGKTRAELLKPVVFAPDSRRYFGIGADLGPAFSMGRDAPGAS